MFKKSFLLLCICLFLTSCTLVFATEPCVETKGTYTYAVVDTTRPAAEAQVLRALPALSTPTGLTWNVDQYGDAFYGSIAWNVVPHCEGEYKICVYRTGESGALFATVWSDLYDHDGTGRLSVPVSDDDIFDRNGTYYFTIQAIGDEMNYADSAVATSGNYVFTLPSAKLATPTNLCWSADGTLTHDAVPNAGGYLCVFFNGNEEIGWVSSLFNSDIYDGATVTHDFAWYLRLLATEGEDLTNISVSVKALSYNIELYQNSAFSLRSDGFPVGELGDAFEGELENILNSVGTEEMSATDALDSLLSFMDDNGYSNLDLALSMGQNEQTAQNIADLEDLYKQEVGVSVAITDTAADNSYLNDRGIDVNKIDVIGAALNSNGEDQVTLTFSEPDPTLSEDSLFYKNSVAVRIGMEGVTDAENLMVPVIISMPLPSGVLPERMMILHYHNDGSLDYIHPSISYVGNLPYATFILTSFSDFVFCNNLPMVVDEESMTVGVANFYGILFISRYDASGVLKEIQIYDMEAESDNVFPISFQTTAEGDYAKFIYWDSDLIPYCDPQTITL